MLAALLTLLCCQLVGEFLRMALHLPIPGAVVGMLLLAAGLILRGPRVLPSTANAALPATPLEETAGLLITHMGLLFVPAGVGIIAQIDLLRRAWLPILVATVGSTLLSLVVTGGVLHRQLVRRPGATR